MKFAGFCFLERSTLDFDNGRKYISHVNILTIEHYSSGLRKGTQSVFELVDIKMVVQGNTVDRQPRGDGVGNRRK
jgi:hypothetical protein